MKVSWRGSRAVTIWSLEYILFLDKSIDQMVAPQPRAASALCLL